MTDERDDGDHRFSEYTGKLVLFVLSMAFVTVMVGIIIAPLYWYFGPPPSSTPWYFPAYGLAMVYVFWATITLIALFDDPNQEYEAL